MKVGKYIRTKATLKKMRLAHKGQTAWNKGGRFSKETKLKMSLAHKGKIGYWAGKKRIISKEVRAKQIKARLGEKSYNWKGARVSYSGIHHWVKRELGKPNKCSNPKCLIPKGRFEWANISQKYKRDLKDFFSLCSSCHKKYDNGSLKITT